MEHLLRLVDSNTTLYAAAVLFTIGMILWFAWARFFHEREGLETVPHFVIALSLLVLFVGCLHCHGWVGRGGLRGGSVFVARDLLQP